MNFSTRLVLKDGANLQHQCASSRASGFCPPAEVVYISAALDKNILHEDGGGQWMGPNSIWLHGKISGGSCSVLSSKSLEGIIWLLILRALERITKDEMVSAVSIPQSNAVVPLA